MKIKVLKERASFPYNGAVLHIFQMPSRHVRKKNQVRKASPRGYVVEKEDPAKPMLTIKMRRHKYLTARKNPKFVTLVQIGRILNSLSFGLQILSDVDGVQTSVGTRQRWRGFFITAGYLYEAITVIEGMRSRHVLDPFYKEFFEMIGSERFSKRKKLVFNIRNSTGFHLDSAAKLTEEALSKMIDNDYNLVSFDSARAVDYYFEFSDIVDLQYIFHTNGEKVDLIEDRKAVTKEVIDFLEDFLNIGHRCMLALTKELKLDEHFDHSRST